MKEEKGYFLPLLSFSTTPVFFQQIKTSALLLLFSFSLSLSPPLIIPFLRTSPTLPLPPSPRSASENFSQQATQGSRVLHLPRGQGVMIKVECQIKTLIISKPSVLGFTNLSGYIHNYLT